MRYHYRPDSYGGYGYRKKKISGGTVAAVIAMLFIFAAGYLIGNINHLNLFKSSGASSTPSDTGSHNGAGEPVTSTPAKDNGVTLPNGLKYADRTASSSEPVAVGALDSVTASSYLVIDRLTGAVLLEKNADQRIYPGATTQVMTAALALEKGSRTDKVKMTSFGQSLIGSGSARIGLQPNEEIALQDAVAAMLMESASDAANAVAETFGYNDFVTEMVARAKEIGCTGTYFVSPNGAFSSAHFTTASDLARMEAYAQKNADYQALAAARTVVMPADNVHAAGWLVLSHTDALANLSELLAGSGKIVRIEHAQTGVTTQGYTMVCSAVTASGARITAVIGGLEDASGSGEADCLPQMAALLNAAADAADKASGTVAVAADQALNSAQTGGVADVLPVGASLTPAYGLKLTQTEQSLANGEKAVFAAATDVTATITWYSDLADCINAYRKGTETEVGTLTVHDSAGNVLADAIPVVLK